MDAQTWRYGEGSWILKTLEPFGKICIFRVYTSGCGGSIILAMHVGCRIRYYETSDMYMLESRQFILVGNRPVAGLFLRLVTGPTPPVNDLLATGLLQSQLCISVI